MTEREKFEKWAGQFVSKGLIEDMTWEYKAWLAAKDEAKSDVAKGIMCFVNNMIGAFDSGFVDSNKLTLAELYRVAQNHVKDSYGVDVPQMREAWGEEIYLDCKKGSDLPS